MGNPDRRRAASNAVNVQSQFGPLESQVLGAMSDLTPPVAVREVCDVLGRDGYFAYQGVLNCMNRLVAKGVLERARQGSAYVYRPVADLEELTAQVVANVLDRMGGQVDRVICRVLEIDPDVGADAIAEVKRKLGAMRRQRRR